MNRRQIVLHLLREAGGRGVTTAEFLEGGCGSRFGGRLFELRSEGHVIEAEPLRPGSFRYRLTHDVERDVIAPENLPPSRESSGLRSDGVSLGAAAPPAALFGAERSAATSDGAPSPSDPQVSRAAPPPTLFEAPDGMDSQHGERYRDYDPAA